MKKAIHIFNYAITNNGGSVDIYIDGDIVDASTQEMLSAWFDDETSVSYRSFRNSLSKIDAPIYNIFINSYGGHVGDALAMHDLIVDMQSKGKIVNTTVRGMCCSSATLLLLASDNPTMSANSWFMIHTVSGGAYGTVKQLENYAKTMRKFNDKIVDVYQQKTNMSEKEINDLMEAETFFTAQEAQEKGFIKSIGNETPFTNSIKREDWNYANTSVLNLYNKSVKPDTNKDYDMKELFNKFTAEIKNLLGNVKPAEGAKPEDIMNSVSAAITGPFENLAASLEAEVTNTVNATNKEAIQAMVNEAVKPFQDKVTELEASKADLDLQIENLLGAKTNSKEEDAPEVIGGFGN